MDSSDDDVDVPIARPVLDVYPKIRLGMTEAALFEAYRDAEERPETADHAGMGLAYGEPISRGRGPRTGGYR